MGRARGDVRNVAYALDNLSAFAVEEGDLARALIILQESLALHRDLGYSPGVVDGLEDMVRIAPALDQPERAARLLGAAEALRSASGAVRPRYLQAPVERMVASVQAALVMEAVDTAWTEGAVLSLEQAIVPRPWPPSNRNRDVGGCLRWCLNYPPPSPGQYVA